MDGQDLAVYRCLACPKILGGRQSRCCPVVSRRPAIRGTIVKLRMSASTGYSKEQSNNLCRTQEARTKKNGFSQTVVLAGVPNSLRHLPRPHVG